MAELRFDDRVVVITGAGGGLGRSHALLFAARGARVVVNDRGGALDGTGGTSAAAEAVVDEIKSAGGMAVADASDISTPQGGEAVVKAAIDAFGRIDVVVNNAGILRDKSFHKMTPELIDPVIDVHLRGAFWVTSPAWKLFREQGYGRVVNTTSQSGLLGSFGQANYAAAKMGLVGFTRTLAAEGAKYNIKANAIAPLARTRMTEELLGDFAKALDPEQVSPVVAYLAHESCDLTGEILSAAGGRVARYFIGLTRGWFDQTLTPESVAANIDQIRSLDDYLVPANPAEEVLDIARHFS
jgi:NAD(P)-dependent dehydrogenase (short-subunit alcohol dehydrogenase family)